SLYELDSPKVMGILNVTPDSFYSGSRCSTDDALIERRVHQIIDEGADMIDIGGYSSRPNADDISPEEEYSRLDRGLRIIRTIAPQAIVSVDTFRADVARRCVENWGVEIINDISGGDLDDAMFDTVAGLKVPYILMHMRGTPATMNTLTQYDNVVVDVIKDLGAKVQRLNALGVADVIIDPGFGFSKTVEQNYRLMNHLGFFHSLALPLLVGISRKSMIYRPLGITPEQSLNGTTALNMVALAAGTHILRVHDVKEACEAVKIHNLIKSQD
ncbi:MAG: dihydropteroate synthase, partial [Bacteroidales bacterium]|nr:dihydropteroate synthase [Bacteroidales bacterium]